MANTYRRKNEPINSYYTSELIPFISKHGGIFYKDIPYEPNSKEFKKAKALFQADCLHYGHIPKEYRKNTEKVYRKIILNELYKSLTILNYEEIIPSHSKCKRLWYYF